MSLRNPRSLALPAASLVVLWLCWQMLRPMVDVLLWAAVLAILSYPVFAKLRSRGASAHMSSLAATGVVVATVLLPVLLIVLALVSQIKPAIEGVRAGVQSLLDPNSQAYLWLSKHISLDFLKSDDFAQKVSAAGTKLANILLGAFGSLAAGVVQVFFVLFVHYYLLRDADQIVPAVRRCMPLSEEQSDMIFARTRQVISASVKGVVIIAAIQGFLGFIAFWALGISSPVVWGVVMFVLSTIPMAGAFIVWVPAAIYLAATGHWVKASLLTGWGVVVIGMADNLLRPRLVGRQARLHDLVVFFSVIGGLQVFGVLGLVIGPVVAAAALALAEIYRQMTPPPETLTPT